MTGHAETGTMTDHRPGRPRVAFADGPWAPTVDPGTVARLAGVDDPDVLLGWTVLRFTWRQVVTHPEKVAQTILVTLKSGIRTSA